MACWGKRWLSATMAVLSIGSMVQAVSFEGLGDFDEGIFFSFANDVTNAGVAVGQGTRGSPFADGEAFRWTQEGGMVGLGDIPGGDEVSLATAVSADGSVVVGWGTLDFSGSTEASRWTQATGMAPMGDLPGGLHEGIALAVSADGSVLAGSSKGSGFSSSQPVRWTDPGVILPLGALPGGTGAGAAHGISADGLVIVGQADSADGAEAFRWTQADGMIGLGDLPGGSVQSLARDTSRDGSVIVGTGQAGPFASDREAFRWTQADGMVGIGDLPGGDDDSQAIAVSDNGNVIVGFGDTDIGTESFVWDPDRGMRNVRQVLVDHGIDMTGWTLSGANGVSPDGRWIAGNGTNPSGFTEAWVAKLGVLQKWVNASNGSWEEPTNWSNGDLPQEVDDVLIQPDFGLTVQGPTNTTTINELTIGAQQAGKAVLELNGGTIIANGLVDIQEGGKLAGNSTLVAAHMVDPGFTAINNEGEIELESGAQLLITNGVLLNKGLVHGEGIIGVVNNNADGGEIRVDHGHHLQVNGIVNTGDINLLGGTLEVDGSSLINFATLDGGGTITGRGTIIAPVGLLNGHQINLSGGFTDVFGETTNDAVIRIAGGSTTTFFEDVENNGDILVDADSTAVFFGDTTGTGAFPGQGLVQIKGTLSPGNNIEAVGFGGDLALTTDAMLRVELDGHHPGSTTNGHDQINVAQTVTLGGTLRVDLLDDFAGDVQLGDLFEIVTADQIVGQFDHFAGDVFNTQSFAVLVPVLLERIADGVEVLALVATAQGDANVDGKVSFADFAVLQNNFGEFGKTWYEGNFHNMDGINEVTIIDFAVLQNNFGLEFFDPDVVFDGFNVIPWNLPAAAPLSLGASIPEPGTLMLLGLSMLAASARRRAV